MNKNITYQNVILTVIALLLGTQVWQQQTVFSGSPAIFQPVSYKPASIQFAQHTAFLQRKGETAFAWVPVNEDGSVDVRIKSAAEVLEVDIEDISTTDELEVTLEEINTSDLLKVDIKEINTSDKLDVNIESARSYSLQNAGPIKIKQD